MRGIQPRAFHMQSERSTAELHPLLGVMRIQDFFSKTSWKWKKKKIGRGTHCLYPLKPTLPSWILLWFVYIILTDLAPLPYIFSVPTRNSGSATAAGADPGFPVGGGANLPMGVGGQHMILPNFPKNCMKLRTFWAVLCSVFLFYVDST